MNYSTFLRKFCANHELLRSMTIHLTISCTYGLNRYRDMPLIEPSEIYKDEKNIRDLVIADDTSGSWMVSWQKKFVDKESFEILCNKDIIGAKCIHVVQCDAEIQDDTVLKIGMMWMVFYAIQEIKVLAEQIFCPVFHYINELIRKKN